MFIEIVTFSIL